MPRSRSLLAAFVLTACASCGAADPAARGAGTAKRSVNDGPLVPYDVATDADAAKALREFYTKHEWMVPMRDGVKLATIAYVPKDDKHVWPMLLQRTPYSIQPYGVDSYPGAQRPSATRVAPSLAAMKDGFVFVHQDVRGRMLSEGTFVDVRPHRTGAAGIDETTDAYDTIEFLLKNVPRHNGNVGTWGISYPGFYAAQTAISGHPALKAASPQAPVTEWFLGDDFHHNGAFFLADGFDFYSAFGKARPKPTIKQPDWDFDYDTGDIYDYFLRLGPLAAAKEHFEGPVPFWDDLMNHGTRDAFWQARDPRPFYKNVKPAVLTVGGFFDAEDEFGALHTYRSFETQSPGAHNSIVLGPWRHGGWARGDGDRLGAVTFGQKTSETYRTTIELPFFQKYLKGKNVPAPAEATAFETGTNEWRSFSAWPPPAAKPTTVYFATHGALATAAPSESATSGDSYLADPSKPVPFTAKPGGGVDKEFMIEDQRFAARRPDVLVYQTAVLANDVTLAGPIEASLWVTTTGTDADFVVKVIDVYSDRPIDNAEQNPTGARMAGFQQLIRAEVFRGKFRDSFETPKPFVPNQPTLVKFTLPDILHTLRPGHRLMVQVQSSWFPLVDRNPQTFVDIYHAAPGDFRAATHTLLHGAGHLSSVAVGVLAGNLP